MLLFLFWPQKSLKRDDVTETKAKAQKNWEAPSGVTQHVHSGAKNKIPISWVPGQGSTF